MLTILGHSVSDKKLKNFRTFTWKSSNNLSDSKTETFWEIKSNFHKFKFIEYLKLKALSKELSLLEMRLLFDAPGVLTDNLYFDALRAWKTDVPKKVLWQRLAFIQRMLDLKEYSPNLYYTYEGTLRYEISELRSSIRKVVKYSGYVRNSSQVGSKRSSNIFKPEPERFEWNTNVEIDYFLFLTVGEFDSGVPGSTIILKMDQSKIRNGNPLIKDPMAFSQHLSDD